MNSTKTYNVYFKVAMYPVGINIFDYETKIYTEFRYVPPTKPFNFNTYLCNKQQSQVVFEYLQTEYSLRSMDNISIYKLQQYNNGLFICKIKFTNELTQNENRVKEIIKDSIYSKSNTMIINSKIFEMDFCICYHEELLDDEDIFNNKQADSSDEDMYYISSDSSCEDV
jgi:hypothetical protein